MKLLKQLIIIPILLGILAVGAWYLFIAYKISADPLFGLSLIINDPTRPVVDFFSELFDANIKNTYRDLGIILIVLFFYLWATCGKNND